ncbi:MAG: hypothetical protein K6U74_21140 [Firmicutes bacterium]|nr:hypothetical protein [Bacillota bacterium]
MLWKKNLYVLCLTQFLVMSSMQLIMPFLPFYIENLGVTEPGAVTVWTGIIASSATFLGNFAGPLAGGLIAARFSVHAVFPVTGALLLINAVWVVKSLVEPIIPEGGETK